MKTKKDHEYSLTVTRFEEVFEEVGLSVRVCARVRMRSKRLELRMCVHVRACACAFGRVIWI